MIVGGNHLTIEWRCHIQNEKVHGTENPDHELVKTICTG